MKITIKDVAKKSGYSISTVSYCLNGNPEIPEETRNKVIEIAKELNYVPSSFARGLKGKKSYNILTYLPVFDGPIHHKILSGISRGISESHYHLIASQIDGNFDLIQDAAVDLVIVLSSFVSVEKIQEISKLKPVIVFDNDAIGDNIYQALMSNKESMYEMTQKMINKGLKRIAYMLGETASQHNRLRYQGYQDALEKNGFELDPSLIIDAKKFAESAGYNSLTEHLQSNGLNFDVLLCSNDELAIGAIDALNEYGYRVPKDVKVSGFDDIQIVRYFKPSITTVRIDWFNYGREIGKYALSIIENPKKAKKELNYKASLVERESTL